MPAFPLEPGTKPLLCIDPGLRCVGMAVFSPSGRLLRAGLARSCVKSPIRGAPAWRGAAQAAQVWYEYMPDDTPGAVPPMVRPQLVVVEEQKINFGRTKNPDDLLQCNGAAGAISMAFADCLIQGVIPENWKGSIPKEDMTARIQSRLEERPEELRCVESCPTGLRHNILDAVGIGLWFFGRLAPRRVIAR